MYAAYVQVPLGAEEGVVFPRAGVVVSCLTGVLGIQPLHVVFLSQGLSLTLELIHLARPASQQALGICRFLTPRCIWSHMYIATSNFYVGLSI